MYRRSRIGTLSKSTQKTGMDQEGGERRGPSAAAPPAPATFSSTATPAPVYRPIPGGCERERKGSGAGRAASCNISDRPAVLILRAFPYPHPTSLCVVRSTAALPASSLRKLTTAVRVSLEVLETSNSDFSAVLASSCPIFQGQCVHM